MMVLKRRPPPLTDDEVEALGLTQRELEVLYLIAAGSSTAEVASVLYLSVNSVKTHTQALFRKIGVTSRLQAAVWVWSRKAADPLDSDERDATPSPQPALVHRAC